MTMNKLTIQDVFDQSEKLGRYTMRLTTLGEKFKLNEQMLFSMGFDKDGDVYIYNSSGKRIEMTQIVNGYSVKISTPDHRFDIVRVTFVDALMKCAECCGISLHPIIM